MRRWGVRGRAWAEFPGPESRAWRLLPEQYTGEPADVLRRLENQLTGDGGTTVVHRSGRLVLSTYDDLLDATTYQEYEVVDRFLAEFEDVAADVELDLDATLVDVDPLVGRFVADLIVDQFTPGQAAGEHVRQLMSLLLWMFMMGREHALRGYPLPASGAGDELVTRLVVSAAFDEEPDRPALAMVREGFGAEFREVAEDVFLDYRTTLIDLDDEVGRKVDLFVVELVRLSRSDPETLVAHLLSAARWMFLLGRAHAERGYQAPVPRGGSSDLPDTVEDLGF